MILIQGKGVSKGVTNGPIYFFQRPDAKISMPPPPVLWKKKRALARPRKNL